VERSHWPAWSRRLRDSLRNLLLGTLLLTAVTPATVASDNDSNADPQVPAQGVPTRILRLPDGPPMRAVERLFSDNPGCARVKLDVWFERGRHTYTVFMAGDGPAQRADLHSDSEGTTILLGNEGCRHRIRIDRAD
jgi:hypothetical protein